MEEARPIPFEELWLHYNLVRGAGENLAKSLARGEDVAIVTYGDTSSLGDMPLTSLEPLGDNIYSLRFADGASKICTVIARGEVLESCIPYPPSPCARNIPGCTLEHGPEEISAG